MNNVGDPILQTTVNLLLGVALFLVHDKIVAKYMDQLDEQIEEYKEKNKKWKIDMIIRLMK